MTPMPQIFHDEPESPSMKTSVPGPKTKELLQKLDKVQDTRTLHFVADYEKSRGNYIADADGNLMLDTLANIASIAIGYNNPSLIAAAKSPEWTTALINRPALAILPGKDWIAVLDNIMSVAPSGLHQVFTAMCGTCANEIAYKAVFMAHQHKARNKAPFTVEELQSCMINQTPGSPNLSILSFSGGFHGRLFGALSTTHSKPLHKLDIPAFNWPMAKFPEIRYPLDQNEAHNREAEAKSLEEVENKIKTWPVKVAGVVIEPIQGEGGDNRASADFYRKLREITKRLGVSLIVDEVQTGVGATGKFWAHEHWGLKDPPDAVTFAKKMQLSGFYHNIELRPSEGYRNFNTWCGDPVRALQASVILKEIKEKHLIENVRITGEYLHNGLIQIQSKYPGLVSQVRGQGTYLAFSLPNPSTQSAVLTGLRQRGVEATGSGDSSVRLRPMLIFAPKHAAQYLDILDTTLKSLKN